MADEKLNTGPAENISPEAAEPIATPEQAVASEPQQEQTGPAISLALINRRRCLCREDTGRMERAYGMEKRRRSLLRRMLTALWWKQRPSCKGKS